MTPYANVTGGQNIGRRLKELQRKFSERSQVYVGLPADAGMHPNAGMTYAHLGAIHEFGAGDNPERSFLRVPLRSNQQQIAGDFRRLIKMVSEDKMTMSQALNQIGARGAAISQAAISAGIDPPNAASTARRKGSTKPLIDDGHLRQAITWVVEGE